MSYKVLAFSIIFLPFAFPFTFLLNLSLISGTYLAYNQTANNPTQDPQNEPQLQIINNNKGLRGSDPRFLRQGGDVS